jgi:hypothetical protein
VARAYPLQPVHAVSNRVLAGGWKGSQLTHYDLALDPDTGNGFYISFRSMEKLWFVVYYSIPLTEDGRNPRVVNEVHAVATNYLHMLNACRLKEAA